MQQVTDRMRDLGQQDKEGPLTGMMDTVKIPSDTFLWAAMASIATSLTFQIMGKKENALFVGQWAPTFVILALYNKISKSGNRNL